MQESINKNTTLTQLEPVFWNMAKSKFPSTGESPSISLFCQCGSLCSPQLSIYTAQSSCSQAAWTAGSLRFDNFPDLCSWVFMMAALSSRVFLGHSVPTALLLSPVTISPSHPALSTYFYAPRTLNVILTSTSA